MSNSPPPFILTEIHGIPFYTMMTEYNYSNYYQNALNSEMRRGTVKLTGPHISCPSQCKVSYNPC